MAENIPNERASYDAAATTPRPPVPQQLQEDLVNRAFELVQLKRRKRPYLHAKYVMSSSKLL